MINGPLKFTRGNSRRYRHPSWLLMAGDASSCTIASHKIPPGQGCQMPFLIFGGFPIFIGHSVFECRFRYMCMLKCGCGLTTSCGRRGKVSQIIHCIVDARAAKRIYFWGKSIYAFSFENRPNDAF